MTRRAWEVPPDAGAMPRTAGYLVIGKGFGFSEESCGETREAVFSAHEKANFPPLSWSRVGRSQDQPME